MEFLQKRAWAEVSLDNIAHNYNAIRERLPEGCRFLAVVKTNAYGHGARRVAELCENLGADYLAATSIDDATQMRSWGIKAPILIFGYTHPEYTEILIRKRLTQTVDCLEAAREYSNIASKIGQRLKVHLKLDTGMGRLGFVCHGDRDSEGELLETLNLPGLDIEGIFTHLAVSDAHDDEYTNMQLEAFSATVKKLEEKAGFRFKLRHCANSGAVINYRQTTSFDMVRPGIMLYGLYPGRDSGSIELRPAMELKTRVIAVKELQGGDSVSYGCTFTAEKTTKIAVLSIGYGDGLHRVLSGKMDVLINGKRVRQIGLICMDFCMVDVSGVPCAVGDVATIFGRDGDEYISLDEVAEKAGTISYEITCALTERVPRVYIGSSGGV